MIRSKMPSIPYLSNDFRPPTGHIISVKMDGEDTSIYADGYFHIRSTTSTSPSKNGIVKAWASMIAPILEVSNLHRMIFENVYDQHSIHYQVATDNPLHAFYQCLFLTELRDEVEWVIPYSEQVKLCSEWGIGMPPLLAKANGINKLSTYVSPLSKSLQEGLVVRHPDEFELRDVPNYVGKWVRPGHVQTNESWYKTTLRPNEVVYQNEDLIEYEFHRP